MAIQHGVNITASDVKDLVESGADSSGRKTWQDLYGNSALSYQAQNDALLKSYGDTIAEAYKASLQQQNVLYDLGLSANDTHDLQNIARQDMLAAYSSYLGQYQEAQQEIAEAYQSQKNTWDQALIDESTNFANLYNYAMQYYNDVLKGATYTETDYNSPVYVTEGKESKLSGYDTKINSLVDTYGLQWMQKENPDGTYRDLTQDELANLLFDKDGYITDYGKNFYDLVFNFTPGDEGYVDTEGNALTSFDSWLSENDNDLYEWVHSSDTFNYTHAGTKLGTAKSFVGLDSEDNNFSPYQVYDSAEHAMQTSLKNLDAELKANTTLQEDLNEIKGFTENNTKSIYGLSSSKRKLNTTREEVLKASSEYISTLYSDIKTLTDTVSNTFSDSIGEYSDEIEKILKEVEDYTLNVPTFDDISKKYGTSENIRLKYRDEIVKAYNSLTIFGNDVYRRLNKILKQVYSKG